MAKTVLLLKNVKNTANDPLPPLTTLCECRESHEKTTLSQGEGEFGKFIFGHNIFAMIVGIRKVLNLGFKAEKQHQNENHTEDWALGSYPRDTGYVTH